VVHPAGNVAVHGGARMSDANAPPPADPAHDTLANLYGLGTPQPDPDRDLRTLAEKERDDVASLRREIVRLVDVVQAHELRIDELERRP